jgi:hypothetical protein
MLIDRKLIILLVWVQIIIRPTSTTAIGLCLRRSVHRSVIHMIKATSGLTDFDHSYSL